MAQERLKKQVEDLKEKVFKKIQPYVVIDENIILNDLPLLKKWISSKSCKIIIPLNGNLYIYIYIMLLFYYFY